MRRDWELAQLALPKSKRKTKRPDDDRLCVLLKGESLLGGTLTLIHERDGQFTLRVCSEKTCQEMRTEGEILGADAGYTELFTTSNTDELEQVGEDFGKVATKISDARMEKDRRRQPLYAQVRELRKSGKAEDLKKAKRIEKHNLGRKKLAKVRKQEEAQLKCLVNRALNNLLSRRKEPIQTLIVEDLSRMVIYGLGKRMNRRLCAWLRGYIKKRLEEKCKLFGVKLEQVNPAYTSQICPQCGLINRRNRNGNTFKCLNCGLTAHADWVGAYNLKTRWEEKKISRRMRPSLVKASSGPKGRSPLEGNFVPLAAGLEWKRQLGFTPPQVKSHGNTRANNEK